MRVPEILRRLREGDDARGIATDLLVREDHPDAHRRIMTNVDLEHRRHVGPAPDPTALAARVRGEAQDVYGWSNGPADRYAEHEHPYTKLLYCTRGSIDFTLADGRHISLEAGDRLVLLPHTRHSAVVGPAGCACVEGKLPGA
ncbi:MAG: hypothetical protein E6I51_11545 [Chloroflexi bacterium]|nr:MAG: hypothetical protein E6I51_11545 [Chloroflexota bacterium]